MNFVGTKVVIISIKIVKVIVKRGIRTIFVKRKEENKDFLSFILNLENKEIMYVVSKKGFLILELINLLKEKWLFEKKVLTPRKFKEICGEYNPVFKTSEQQDAHDFYTFLVDKLHEETNIKYRNDNSYTTFKIQIQ